MIQRLSQLLARAKHLFINDSLFRNAVYLMASTAIMSVFGFGFWVFIAHLYRPADIGTASALMAVMTLLSNLSLLGLNSGLVRFLPKSKDQSRDINAAIVAVVIATTVAAILYLFASALLGIHISLLRASWQKIAFIVLMSAVSLNTLTDAVFVANRRAEYHTIGYTLFALVKLLVPAFLITLGALGVFAAYILAIIVSLIYSFTFMWKICGYAINARPNWGLLAQTRKFVFNNYVGVVLAGLPSQIMPLLIIKRIGSADVAYFSMAWTMANLLYVVPSAATQSLLAESSHQPEKHLLHVKHTVRLLAQVLIPSVLFAIVIAPSLLKIFGGQYAAKGAAIFQIFAFATFFIAINSVCNTILNIRKRTAGIVITQSGAFVATMVAALFLLRYNLVGVGLSMLAGNGTATLLHLANFTLMRKRGRLEGATSAQKTAESSVPSPVVIQKFLKIYGLAHAKTGEDIGGHDRSSTVIIQAGSRKYVLKVYSSAKHSLAETREEIKFVHFLRDHGVATPHILPTSRGDMIATLRLKDQRTVWIGMLMEFEPGSHPAKVDTKLLRSLAQTQAQIHTYGIEYARLPGAAKQIRRGHSLSSRLLSWAPRGVSHFDFDKDNVLVDGNRVACVIDFEGLRFDPIIVCLFYTLTAFHGLRNNKVQRASYLRAYQGVRKLKLSEKIALKIALILYRPATTADPMR